MGLNNRANHGNLDSSFFSSEIGLIRLKKVLKIVPYFAYVFSECK